MLLIEDIVYDGINLYAFPLSDTFSIPKTTLKLYDTETKKRIAILLQDFLLKPDYKNTCCYFNNCIYSMSSYEYTLYCWLKFRGIKRFSFKHITEKCRQFNLKHNDIGIFKLSDIDKVYHIYNQTVGKNNQGIGAYTSRYYTIFQHILDVICGKSADDDVFYDSEKGLLYLVVDFDNIILKPTVLEFSIDCSKEKFNVFVTKLKVLRR